MTLVILRHGSSAANSANSFSGWLDVDLAEQAKQQLKEAYNHLCDAGFTDFDVCYTSNLKRSIKSAHILLDLMDRMFIEEIKDGSLRERHYGKLTGMDKRKAAEQYGRDIVQQWRRSYEGKPPAIDEEKGASLLRGRFDSGLVLTESLMDVEQRVRVIWEGSMKKHLLSLSKSDATRNGVLAVVHGSTVRALVKIIEELADDSGVSRLEVPNACAIVFQFNEDGSLKSLTDEVKSSQMDLLPPAMRESCVDFHGLFVGDLDQIRKKQQAQKQQLMTEGKGSSAMSK